MLGFLSTPQESKQVSGSSQRAQLPTPGWCGGVKDALRDSPCCPGSWALWSSLPSCLQVDRKTAFLLLAMSALRSHSAGLCGCSWPATCIPHQQGWRESRKKEEEEAPQVKYSCDSPHADATTLARWRRGQQPRDPPTCAGAASTPSILPSTCPLPLRQG